ncbi:MULTISPECIES: APC family permease [unclassified Mycobacterium]|uniref:APC family permease n=1 Tax=unclassified Mycobacterium TaxID=2642494 RepID=UPI0029C9206C|nr:MULTISPECIES: APC family permease [unclassified Mycobacterium]
MAIEPTIESAAPPGEGSRTALAPAAMGLGGVIFILLAGAAPLYAMLFNVPLTVMGSGYAGPAAFIVATVALLIFSVGYIRMSQRVRSAGGFYSFVTAGLGKILGLGSAYVISVCYIVFCAAIIGPTAYFTHGSLQHWFDIDVPAWLLLFVILASSSVLAYFRVGLTARVLSVLMCLELLGLAVFVVAVLVRGGGPEGVSLRPLNPLALFGNSDAVAVFGAAAVGVALFGAFWSWVGFEMAPNYAEESRDPARVARLAMYGSVIGLGVIYTVVAFCFVNGWGVAGVAEAVKAQFDGQYDSAFYPLTDHFGTQALTEYFRVLTITSGFAAQLAFYNTAARYLFSLGRERVLPAWLAGTHPRHGSPHRASLVVTVVVAVYMLCFVLADSSDAAALTKLGTWSPLLGVLGLLAIQALVCVAIIRYFRVKAPEAFSPWATLIAPLLGAAAMVAAVVILLINRTTLSGAGDAMFVRALPWVIGGLFVIGVVTAAVFRQRAPQRYAAIGAFTSFHD